MKRKKISHAVLLRIPAKPKITRSPEWPAVRRKWLKLHPTCAACGRKVKMEVHHIIPLHIDRTRELDTTNFISLCENETTAPLLCHFNVGHLGISWLKYDPDVVATAARLLKLRKGSIV